MNIVTLIPNILDKILLIISFSLIANNLSDSKILNKIGEKSSSFNTSIKMIGFWYCVSFILSGFFNDMTIAALIIPIALKYAEQIKLENKNLLVMSIAFGISSGGDLTIFGGNDNLSALALLQGTQYEFTKAGWTPFFIVPTIAIGAIALLFCLKYVKAEPNCNVILTGNIENENAKVNVIELLLNIALIVLAFFISSRVLIILALALSLVYKTFNIKNIPYKAVIIWTIAFVIGKFIGSYIPALNITNVPLMILLLIIGTNIFTNSALMSGILPVLIASNIPVYALYGAIKAINIAYVSIYGNACLSVASGYGISQKELFKKGLPIAVLSYIIILIYTYILSFIIH